MNDLQFAETHSTGIRHQDEMEKGDWHPTNQGHSGRVSITDVRDSLENCVSSEGLNLDSLLNQAAQHFSDDLEDCHSKSKLTDAELCELVSDELSD